MPTIDIALASYNGENYISEQIESILANQIDTDGFALGSIIVSDNMSTDNTVSIVNEITTRHPNVKLYPNENRGIINNFNHALAQCTAEYVMLCDQDDIWLHNKIQLSLQKLLELERCYGKNCPLLVFTDLHVTDSKLNITADSFFKAQRLIPDSYQYPKHIFLANVAPGCTMIMNRKLLELACPVPAYAAMHDWWLILVASTFGQVAHLDQATILYRQHENNQVGAPSKRYRSMIFSPRSQFQLAGVRLGYSEKQAKIFLEKFTDVPERCTDALYFMAHFRQLSRFDRVRGLLKHKIEHRTTIKKAILYLLALTLPRTTPAKSS